MRYAIKFNIYAPNNYYYVNEKDTCILYFPKKYEHYKLFLSKTDKKVLDNLLEISNLLCNYRFDSNNYDPMHIDVEVCYDIIEKAFLQIMKSIIKQYESVNNLEK